MPFHKQIGKKRREKKVKPKIILYFFRMNRFLLENVLLRPYQLVMAVGTLAGLLINGAHKGPPRFRPKN